MSKILYYVSGLITFLPIIFILNFPIWLTVVLCAIGFALNTFACVFPFPSFVFEAVFWVWGLIVLFNQPFSFFTVIAVIAFVYWLASSVYLFRTWFGMAKNK